MVIFWPFWSCGKVFRKSIGREVLLQAKIEGDIENNDIEKQEA